MRGLTLQITNNTSNPLTITDITGLTTFAAGETKDALYTDEVQNSLEYGRLNSLVITGSVTVSFVSGTNLSQAPIGRTFTGASPITMGERGLVPQVAIAQRTYYLKGDGTWGPITTLGLGAIPQSVLTTQGDLIVRGVTTAERLPLGSLGYILRSGPVTAQWANLAASGLLANRPSAAEYYAGSFYWATDATKLYVCYDDSTTYNWWDLGAGVGGAWDTFPTGGIPSFTVDVTHVGRAAVGVDPSSSIPAGIQFQVLGSSLFTRTFTQQTGAPDPDQIGSTQIRGELTDKGLYSKPDGYSERRMDLPGLARKTIPTPEGIIIPDGSQYICAGVFTLQGVATITLQGDADLVVL